MGKSLFRDEKRVSQKETKKEERWKSEKKEVKGSGEEETAREGSDAGGK